MKNDRITATFIYQLPGTKNDHHYHIYDEWWYIAEGELAWEMEGHPEPIRVTSGDFVFAPANHYHLIHVLGDKPAIRIGSAIPAKDTGTIARTRPSRQCVGLGAFAKTHQDSEAAVRSLRRQFAIPVARPPIEQGLPDRRLPSYIRQRVR